MISLFIYGMFIYGSILNISFCRVLCKNSAAVLKALRTRESHDRDMVSAALKAMFKKQITTLPAKGPCGQFAEKRRMDAILSNIIPNRIGNA